MVRHGIVWIDHYHAEIIRLGAAESAAQHIAAHEHSTQQHHSGVRAEHEFFGQVSDAFESIEFVLVTGSHTALADFRRYMEKHRPHVAPRIAAYQVVDHMTENQLRAIGGAHFARPPGI
jgi:hypothetical protein